MLSPDSLESKRKELSVSQETHFKSRCRTSRTRARQQLAVSSDSPFSREESSAEDSAPKFKDETEEVKKQLDVVKNRLCRLKNQLGESRSEDHEAPLFTTSDGHETVQPKVRTRVSRDGSATSNQRASQAKLRPITGKVDCPNCTCDRRDSVCDRCIGFAATRATADPRIGKQEREPLLRFQPSPSSYNDDRPIRLARDMSYETVESIDQAVVPNKVYTISKSLNEKRTKLSQAIEELQIMIEKVRKKDEKLNQERKVVQLYKDQWKFGPSIGGPSASSQEKLYSTPKRRSYESRLDANLTRDSKSLMGFQHIQSCLKLRQYPIIYPKEKLNPDSSRSKSLDSLRVQPKVDSSLQKAIANFHGGKSSSEVNLFAAKPITEGDDGSIQDNGRNPQASPDSQASNSGQAPTEREEKVQRMAWIPVFGETEIKTVKWAPKRKIQVFEPENAPQTRRIQKKSNLVRCVGSKDQLSPGSYRSQYSTRTPTGSSPSRLAINERQNRVVSEATRKLRFASDILEQDRQESSTKLVVNRVPPKPRPRSSVTPESSVEKMEPQPVQMVSSDIFKEIARLERMLNEQHKIIAELSQSEHRKVASPVIVRCLSPCCNHQCKSSHSTQKAGSTASKNLISSLRERLNRTRAKLAQTLEVEREKYQQLELRVDSSLRKQSDLESENELLKQSLTRCIDTCLKDISNTFESLSDSMADSLIILNKQQTNGQTPLDCGPVLNSAAQLISDNRHLKQMKVHLEKIEAQRKRIFEELSIEKQRNNQLALELKRTQEELKKTHETKRDREIHIEPEPDPRVSSQKQADPPSALVNPETERQSELGAGTSDHEDQTELTSMIDSHDPLKQSSHFELDKSGSDETYNSVEVYRRYIHSMSPDIESVRRERKLILNEFDNIKKMLSDMNQ